MRVVAPVDFPMLIEGLPLDLRWPVCYGIPMAGPVQTGQVVPRRAEGAGSARGGAEDKFRLRIAGDGRARAYLVNVRSGLPAR